MLAKASDFRTAPQLRRVDILCRKCRSNVPLKTGCLIWPSMLLCPPMFSKASRVPAIYTQQMRSAACGNGCVIGSSSVEITHFDFVHCNIVLKHLSIAEALECSSLFIFR